MDAAVRSYPAEFAEDKCRRAEPSDGRLNEVEPDEAGEPQPADVDQLGERDAEQNHAAGEDADKRFSFHNESQRAGSEGLYFSI